MGTPEGQWAQSVDHLPLIHTPRGTSLQQKAGWAGPAEFACEFAEPVLNPHRPKCKMQCSVQMLGADSGVTQQTKAGQSHWRGRTPAPPGCSTGPAQTTAPWDWPRPKPQPGEVDGDWEVLDVFDHPGEPVPRIDHYERPSPRALAPEVSLRRKLVRDSDRRQLR
jgi:hypothetical protein